MAFNQSKLVENIFSMVSLRALEYVLSFILVPYLLIVLGPEKMGAIVFSQSVMVYLVLISSYGFNLTAPRALARSDSSNYAHIFSLYMYGSIVLGVVSTIILVLGGILYQYFGFTFVYSNIYCCYRKYNFSYMVFPRYSRNEIYNNS